MRLFLARSVYTNGATLRARIVAQSLTTLSDVFYYLHYPRKC